MGSEAAIVYLYKSCDRCRRAEKWLREKGIRYEARPIREQPPSEEELRIMLDEVGGELGRLFNTAGQDYRALGIKDRIRKMSAQEAFQLLSQNGNLVKRPFLITARGGTVGFEETRWNELTQ